MMPRIRFDKPWRTLWELATSDYLLVAVLLSLAPALLWAAWLPQTSIEDPASDVVWQGEVQRRFGGIAWFNAIRPALQAIGAFHVANAAWFRILLALLTFSLLARLFDCAESSWQAWRGEVPEDATQEREENAEHNEHRLLGATQPFGHRLWRELGSVGIYLSSLVILSGAVVTNLSMWQKGPFPIAPGESVPLGNGSDLTLRLESLTEDGKHGIGEIWRGDERLLGAGNLAIGQPLSGGGVGVFLVGSGPGLRVQATLSETQRLELATGQDTEAQQDLILAFTEKEPRHLVGVPEADLVLLVQAPQNDQSDIQSRVQAFELGSGEFILEQNRPDDTTLTVGDVSFSLMPISYAQVRVVHDRGAFWIQLGVTGLIAGTLLRAWWSVRRSWAHHQVGPDQSSGGVDRDLTISQKALILERNQAPDAQE